MNKQNIRLFLICALFLVGMLLYSTWQQEHETQNIKPQVTTAGSATTPHDLPNAPVSKAAAPIQDTLSAMSSATIDPSRIVNVSTDVLNVKIDALGGDLIYLNLPKYPQTLKDPEQGFILLNESSDRFYIVQTGLLSDAGPDSSVQGRALYAFNNQQVVMPEDESILNVDLNYVTKNGVRITKRYIFERGSYEIRLQYLIDNKSNMNYVANSFGRIKRRPPEKEKGGFLGGAVRSYTGAAINTPTAKYQKISFADMQEKPFKEDVRGGWAAMVEHYFVTAIIPSIEEKNHFQTEKLADDIYSIGFVGPTEAVAPGMQKSMEVKLYAGPETAQNLKAIAPGLELTIDYGWLWFLCQPIFWLLRTVFDLVHNWGVAIILTTIIIKALFYKLSASSYKSMGNLRKLQPRIEELKQRHADDKQRFSQAMMELYKKEKVNPLGGCLPILVQIPVFIALYYVLMEAVELRQAPFMLWIHDLSAKDPYYVLPIIMGATMFVQQRLNPMSADPTQAKIMMFMPIFFTFLFLQFPAGLVLYWVVNNVLSILQQWLITTNLAKSTS